MFYTSGICGEPERGNVASKAGAAPDGGGVSRIDFVYQDVC